MTMSRGVFYVATQQLRYIEEAAESAASLRSMMPGVHVTLFTDVPQLVAERGAAFDAISTLPVPDELSSSWGAGLLGKVRAFVRAPYERSLYLDTDTRVLDPRVAEVFTMLERCEVAIAACELGESRGQLLYGHRMFNSGVIGLRRTPRVQQLVEAWLALQEAHVEAVRVDDMDRFEYVRHLRPGGKRYQLVADQTALARFLSPEVNVFEVEQVTLPKPWNWRNPKIGPEHAGQVVIHHAHIYKARVEEG